MDKELWDAFILKKDHKEAVRLLRLQDPNVFYQNEPDLLHHSISRGWLDVTRDLINKYHFDPHQYYHHEPCLYTAAEGNHIDIVEYLMKECGCDPMMPATEHGNVPVLHKVASQGLLDVLKCIVMNIDGHIMDGQYWDTYGQSVLFRAVKHIDVLKYLINCHCCDVMTRDEYGKTLLHHAVEHIDVVKYLIKDCNCNVMVTDKKGRTPLHYAASEGVAEVIEYLLSNGNCDPLAKENKGKTPLQLAKGRQNSDAVIAIFKKFGNIKQSHPIDSYVNVLLVGNPGAGKSTLSHVIKETATGPFVLGSFRNVGDVEPCTAGVIPYKLQHRTLGNIILHDFAGHSEYYSSHSAVIENLLQGSGGLFLIVVNILEKEAVKQLYQWLSVVRNEAQKTLNQCHVIVIVSHVDEVSNLFEKRRKEVIQEIIVSERCDSVFLDCRKCGGSGVDSFFNKLSSACESIRSTSGRNSSLYCHMMYGLLEERKENILTLSDITLPFKHNDNYIVPDDKNEIAELLDSLHSTGLISVLKSEDKVWVVMNKGILLTEVDGILFAPKTLKKHADIASNTGIVSVPDLTRLFPKYDPDMLICFLKNMQLCQELDPSFLKMTNLIAEDRDETGDSASETQRRGERLLFFPCLLSTGRPKEMTCQVYQFGWCLHCTREHDFFPPRYFHVLSLRLAFKFSFSKGNKKLAEKLNHECKFWSNGFHWFNGHGVKVLVEIVDESQCVLVMMSCKKGYSDNMVSLRRVVIGEVMNVYKESCPSLKVEELIIDPEELAYPVNRPRERTVYGVFNFLSSINQERPYLVCVKGQKKLKEILSDESLIRADVSKLSLLGGRDIKEVLRDSYINQDHNQEASSAGIETNSQFLVVPYHSDDKTSESRNNTDMNHLKSEIKSDGECAVSQSSSLSTILNREERIDSIFGDMTDLIVDSSGLIHHCSQYGFTLIIPEGAVQEEKTVTVHFGTCLYNIKFKFGNYIPVTPIVWVHMSQELMKPAELYLPHHVDATYPLTKSKLTLLTAKDEFFNENELHFTKNDDSVLEVDFALCKISRNHFCSTCAGIEKSSFENIQKRCWLAVAEKQESDVTFLFHCIIFPLQLACKKIIEQQYLQDSKFSLDFSFKEMNFDTGSVSLIFDPDHDNLKTLGWTSRHSRIYVDEISEDDVDYHKVMHCQFRDMSSKDIDKPPCQDEDTSSKDIEKLKDLEKHRRYPPRFCYEFTCIDKAAAPKVTKVIVALQGSSVNFRYDINLKQPGYDPSQDASDLLTHKRENDISFQSQLHLDSLLLGCLEVIPSIFEKCQCYKKWFPFGLSLGLNPSELLSIESRYRTPVQYARAILLSWREKNKEASLESLTAALEKVCLSEAATELQHHFQVGLSLVDTTPAERVSEEVISTTVPEVAHRVMSEFTSAIKNCGIELSFFAAKLLEKKIINDRQKRNATDEYSGRTTDQRMDQLLDIIRDSVKQEGKVFEYILEILKEEDTILAKKLHDNMINKYEQYK